VLQSQYLDLHFPRGGIDRSVAFAKQPNRPDGSGAYTRTSVEIVNMRGYAAIQGRNRGGTRPLLGRWMAVPVVAGWLIQELVVLVGTYDPPGGGVAQTTSSGRLVTLVAVSQGNVYVANAGDTDWTSPTNNTGDTPPLIFTGLIQSAENNQRLYFADGNNWVYYQPSDNTLRTWAATAGTLPVDESGNKPRLICTWRGRTTVSGLLKDPQNIFLSRVNDPYDFDYAPDRPSATQAVALNLADSGSIGDFVTALIPWSDDVLVVGCDHTLWTIQGDPMAGGTVNNVSRAIGVAWGKAWCQDPYGNLYFVSNTLGVYKYSPGSVPVRISTPVEQFFQGKNTGENTFRLMWDDVGQGVYFFVSKTASPGLDDVHMYYDARNNAWFKVQFKNRKHNPLVCCVFDGNRPDDRVSLIGSWDGYVRFFDDDAATDDGYPCEQEVWVGPISTKNLDDVKLKSLQAVLAEDSGVVDYSIHVGDTAEAAFLSDPIKPGQWSAGRNLTDEIERSGHAVYIKMTATSRWALEQIRALISVHGKPRMRGR